MEPNLWFGVVGLIGAGIGALGAIAGQWFSAKHTERVEYARWEHEKTKDIRQAIREYRKERVRPILDALDCSSSVYSVGWASIKKVMGEAGYNADKYFDPREKKALEEQRRKRLEEKLDKTIEGVSAVGRISDPELRKVLIRALWRGITREYLSDEHLDEIDDAYNKLEAWIFRPVDEGH